MKIGSILHEYGYLVVKEEEGKFFWSIEANTFEKWEEIPLTLYTELVKFNRLTKGE